MVRHEFPRLVVLSYGDLPPQQNVQPVARLSFTCRRYSQPLAWQRCGSVCMIASISSSTAALYTPGPAVRAGAARHTGHHVHHTADRHPHLNLARLELSAAAGA